MSINPLSSSSIIPSLFSDSTAETKNTEGSFANVLSDALRPIAETEAVDEAGNMELLSGDLNALHTTLIDAEKAEIALQLTLQIRNKVIDAYSEVMRMSI